MGQIVELTTRVPVGTICFDLTPETLFDVGQGVVIRLEDFPEQGNVGDGQPQGVDFWEALFVREGGHVDAQFVKRWIYAAVKNLVKIWD